jgi:hypothetical protein
MAKRKSRPEKGISRIDQAGKRTHGFFVRLTRKGKVYSAFFADKSLGGKARARTAARKHYQMLLQKHGAMSRRKWAQIQRRKGASGVMGVRKVAIERGGRSYLFWMASWSPSPHVVRRRIFSVRKHGSKKAKTLAVTARQAGVRNMED